MVIFILLIVVLLPHAVCDSHIANCRIWQPQFVHHKYYQPGDLIIGGVVFQNLFWINPRTSYQYPPQPELSRTFIQNYQHILAFEFAVKEINENQQLLPNITLGFNIYDSYLQARGTYQATLQLISPKDRLLPNYKCDNKSSLMAVTEELTSDNSHQLVGVLGIYKILQLLFGSAADSMNMNQEFSVYQAEPNRAYQYYGIIQLLLYFNWTWIGFITADEIEPQWFTQDKFQEFSRNGICFAILESLSSLAFDKKETVIRSYNKIMNHKVNVLVSYGDIRSMLYLRWMLNTGRNGTNHKPRGKVWILTTHMDLQYSPSYKGWDITDFYGTLSFATHSNELPGFQSFLLSRNLSINTEDGFLKDFWENAFQCTFSSPPTGDRGSANCTGEERLENLSGYIFPMNITGRSYTIYNAVHALARALHAMYVSISKKRTKMEGKRALQTQQPWQLHHFLKMVSFNNSAGDQISFDQNGELIPGFDIMNWVMFANQSLVKVKVGRLDPRAPPHEAITINQEAIVWHSWFNQAQPFSVCNDNCSPGYRKRIKEGETFCCYDCIPCPEGKISDQKDMADCSTCASDHYPNKDQTSCIPKRVIFLSYEQPLGIVLAICALSFVLVTALVLSLFMKHHNSAIVKANNRSLTYTLLISLLLCFLYSLIYIGRPEKVVCILRQIGFTIIFTITMFVVLAKTVTVVLVFITTQPGSAMLRWLRKKLASSIFFLCLITEAVICIVQLAICPSYPYADMASEIQEIILDCTQASPIILCIVVICWGTLAILIFTIAFIARKLPDVFNEAKFITLSMLVTCSVWVAYSLVYINTTAKNRTAIGIFFSLVSCASFLSFMFFPKCYIILYRPQLSIREQLRKWKR